MTNDGENPVLTPLDEAVDAVGWGLFFIWIGIAVIADLGWAAGLLGVAALIIGSQLILYLARRPIDALMVTCGLALLVVATWEIFAFTWSLIAALMITIGIGVMVTSLMRQRRGPRQAAQEPLLPL